MAYIGIDPNVGDITFQKFTGTGSATAFTLAQAVVSGEAIVVTIGNVVQEPGSSAAYTSCLLYTSPSPRDRTRSRMPSSA